MFRRGALTFVLCLLPLLEVYADYAVLLSKKSQNLVALAESVIEETKSTDKAVIWDINDLKEYDKTSAQGGSGVIDLVITVGSTPYKAVAHTANLRNTQTLIVASFLSRNTFESNRTQFKNTTAVFNDSSPRLQLKLAKSILQDKDTKIGFIYSPWSKHYLEDLDKYNAQIGKSITIVSKEVSGPKDIQKALLQLIKLHDIDAVIMQPDNNIYDRSNLKTFLFTLNTKRIAPFVNSPGLVNKGAGGLASTYFKNKETISAITQVVDQYLANEKVAPPSYPSIGSVVVNKRLAHSLHLIIKDPDTLEGYLNAN